MSCATRCLLWLAALLPFVADAAPPPGYHLAWGDEFSGTNINSAKWNWGALPWGGQHHNDQYASYITPEDSYLSGGSLVLRCRQGNFGGYPWSEGFVHSNGKYRYTYGYVEVRARWAIARGTWPAFWTLSDGWPPEFDISEPFGSDNRVHMGLYYGSWDSSNLYNEGFQNWHTWGLEWGPGYAKWYMDGVVRKTISASYVPDQSMYLILNSGMRYDYDGSTPNPNYSEIDYCRVYLAGGSTTPVISDISSRTTPTNTPTPPLPFTIDDSETPLNELILTATSANTALVPTANIVISGTGANRTVVVTPASNLGGSSLITLTLSDGQFTVDETFTLTVSGTNSSPTISALADLQVPMNAAVAGRVITVTDNETPLDALTLSVTTSNPDVIPLTNISLSGGGSNRLIVFKPALWMTGSSILDVTVSDGGLSAHNAFRVTVSDPNNVITNGGFEDGLGNYVTVFGGTLTSSASTVHDGLVAGKLTGRADWYNGLGTSLLGRVTNGATYRCSAWVRISGTTTNDNGYLTVRQQDNTGTHYYSVVQGRASSSTWTRLSGEFTPTNLPATTQMVLYAEGPAAAFDLYVDDISVMPRDPNVLVPLGSAWRYLDKGTTPGANWTNATFSDLTWSNGPAQLGYGDGDEARVVSFGAQSANKYITTWFRKSFTITDLFAFNSLLLRYTRDDGAAIYLNGMEVVRDNLPAGPLTATTLALTAVTAAEESRIFTTNLAASLLVPGTNILAVEIHQDATNSSDISFDLELIAQQPAPDALIAARSDWRYNDTGANLGTAWRDTAYNDSAWPAGFGQLGYGDGDENTIVSYGTNAGIKYITTYFRRVFTLPNPPPYDQYLLNLQRDDGAIVYLNGAEIFRSNITNAPVSYLTPAFAALDDGNTWLGTNLPPGLFVAGTNIIAAEVHQSAANSTDLSFDLELLGYRSSALPSFQWVSAGNNWTLQWPGWAGNFLLYTSTNFLPPGSWTLVTSGLSTNSGRISLAVPPGESVRFYQLRR